MPVVEIAVWTPSEAFEDDKSIINPALDFLKNTDGCKAVYSGFAEEENTYFLFLVWETLQHHQNLIAHPEYPHVTHVVPTIGAGGIKMNHVEFNKDFIPAVSAPSTEILEMALKEGKTKGELYTLLGLISSSIDEGNIPEYNPATFGPTVEDSTKFYLTAGWKSSAFHLKAVEEPERVAAILKLREIVDYKLVHVNFTKR
ncbi:hypothetical protein CPB84DRAFT_1750097 [Gymnopilus junonius]|uniref:ABM domain-containing protein n=1 Tax=Gymnopilus junonius TaxID=109634 RepID=A0A9P5NFR9_GYMJU|nr:hypothetical protein CPB84DRAFT_1750097 [Gymnopilus junonius]